MKARHYAFARAAVTVLAAALVITCQDNQGPQLGRARRWTTPTGLVTATPPELLLGAGDIATCAGTGDEATALLLDSIPTGIVFNIGDDAYESGTDAEFANCYEPNWGRHKARTRPAPGNHEYNTADASGYFNYFGAAAGELGKGYYSYDLGDWHIIVLNSSGGSAGTNISMAKGSAQELWLAADLAAHPNLCTLAYFHYPLYSSTSGTGSGGVTMPEVRPLWDDLYAAGADLIVNGHRHFYERQAPQRPDRTTDPVSGIREIIVGTGGRAHIGSDNVSANSEVRNSDSYGVLKLWLYADSYAWKFVPIAGKTFTDSGSTACHAAPGGTPVSAAQSTLAAAPGSLTAGSGSATIAVTVKDDGGNPISGATVVLAATGGGNTLTQPGGPTDASGVATGTLSSTVAGVKTVSATANGTAITETAVVTVNAGPPSASQSTVAAAPASIAVGTGTATITVTAKDDNGNPISGATVVLSATGSDNTLTQPAGPTDANGVATGTLSSIVAGDKTISATAGGTAITQTATVTVTAAAVSATVSTVSAAPASLTAASGSATITVTVKDGSGNPISGATVVLAATGSGNTLTQPSGPTDAGGVATGALSSTVAGTKTVSASANGTAIVQTAGVTFAAGPVSGSRSTVAASPTSIPAGSSTSTITVTVKDANGNPISGAAVALAATGSGNALTQPGPTNASGVATGALKSTVAETKTVSATADGTPIAQTVTLTVTAVSASGSTVKASPTSIRTGATSKITVTVKDAAGRAMPGITVVLAASGTGNNFIQPAPTDASGTTSGTFSSSVKGTKTISATANGTLITQTATVTVK